MALPLTWGTTAAEEARPYPADEQVIGPALLMTRGITVAAPVEVTWRWLCQIAVAPYSYDWIDNRGRRSPRELTPGADRLKLGQTMAVVFRLVTFDDGHHWTAVTGRAGERLFGPIAITYAAEPADAGSRILCRLAAGTSGPLSRVKAHLLAWGDLVMMRRQLLNLKELAERDARRGSPR